MEPTQERPPIKGSPISAVVPTSIGGEAVTRTVRGLVAYLKTLQRPVEVIVSPEAGAGDLSGVAALDPIVRLLPGEGVVGYGRALRAGIEAAQYPLVVTVPGEGGYRPEELAGLIAQIDQADVVCGYRALTSRPDSWLKRIIVRMLFGLRFRDRGCRFRLYRRSIFARIPIQSRGGFADTEILAKANFLGCLFAEAEVSWSPPAAGPARSESSADFLRVFRHPDFGPARVDAPSAAE